MPSTRLEADFPWVLGEVRQARERGDVRVVVAGPNAFVYFLDSEAPLAVDAIDRRAPSLVDDLSLRLVVVEGEHQFQVATFRTEADYRDGRHPSQVRH